MAYLQFGSEAFAQVGVADPLRCAGWLGALLAPPNSIPVMI